MPNPVSATSAMAPDWSADAALPEGHLQAEPGDQQVQDAGEGVAGASAEFHDTVVRRSPRCPRQACAAGVFRGRVRCCHDAPPFFDDGAVPFWPESDLPLTGCAMGENAEVVGSLGSSPRGREAQQVGLQCPARPAAGPFAGDRHRESPA